MTNRVFLLVAVAGLLAACSTDDGDHDTTGRSVGTTARSDPYVELYASLCGVTASSQAGDADAARDAFFDRVHQPLHDLARDVAAKDRRVAAALHEAKQQAESGLRSHSPASGALARLTRAAHDAVSVVTSAPAACPEGAA